MSLKTYNIVRSLFKKSFERSKEEGRFIFKHSDAMITWLIGFAVGGIYLAISDYDKLHDKLKGTEKYISISLACTIIFGILYRLFQHHLIIRGVKIDTYFLGVFNDEDIPPTSVDQQELSSLTYDQLVGKIKNDFDENVPIPTGVNDVWKAAEIPKLIKYYTELCEYSKRQLDLALDQNAEMLEKVFKIKKEKSLESFENSKIGFDLKVWHFITLFSFYLSVGSFMIAIAVLAIKLF